MSMLLGIVFTLCGCAWLWMITFFNSAQLQVIGPSILIGIGGSVLIVTSLAMGTDLIGPHCVSLLLRAFYVTLHNDNNNNGDECYCYGPAKLRDSIRIQIGRSNSIRKFSNRPCLPIARRSQMTQTINGA